MTQSPAGTEPVLARDVGVLAQAWQELLDTRFPQGVNINTVGSDDRLAPPTLNLPVLVVMSLRGQWPVLRGFPLQAPQGLDLRIVLTSWTELDRPTFAVRCGREGDRPVVLSARISAPLAEQMAPLRVEQREILTAQAEAVAREELDRLGASPVVLSASLAGLLFPSARS